MTLEPYCRHRLVILKASATVYEAARAMQENHVGMVVVEDGHAAGLGLLTDRDLVTRVVAQNRDPSATHLGDIMSEAAALVPETATMAQVVSVMRNAHVRRLPIVNRERVVGVITLDDVLMSGEIDLSSIANVVRAQLAEPAALKPEGATHPLGANAAWKSGLQHGPETRHHARAQQSENLVVELVRDATGLGERKPALTAFEIVLAGIVRRLSPAEAHDMLSQLPAEIRERMESLCAGPDRSVTRESLQAELARSLQVDAQRASDLLVRVGGVLSLLLSPGQVEQVRGQLPHELRAVLPQPVPD